ncbi:MAG: hypothetical protein Nk1A_7860 [Endomicrobiia bacterium]|nr:MAG: hypothetical protein Nk1A_7860 [Endomicrobiia bacterium]
MDHPNDYIAAAAAESLEEVSEEVLQDLILGSLSAIDNAFRSSG